MRRLDPEVARVDLQPDPQAAVDPMPTYVLSYDRHAIVTMATGGDAADELRLTDRALGRSMFDLYADYPDIVAATRSALRGDGSDLLVHLRGRWVQAHHRPLRRRDGEIMGGIVSGTDVTQRIEAGEAMRRAEARTRAVLRHVSEIIVLLEPDGTMRDAIIGSPGPFGWQSADVLGRHGWDLVHPDDVPRLRQLWDSLLADRGGRRDQVEFRVRQADGTWGWAEETLTNALDDPAVQAVIANCRDVTDRHRAQEALRHSEWHSRRIVEASSDALAVLDASGRIAFANPKFGELAGCPTEHLVGVMFDTLGFPDPASPTDDPVRHDIRGDARWVRVSAQALDRGDDDSDRTLISIADDTERVLLHERVRQSERLQVLGRFASGVAHDFNNVLSAVRGNAELLIEALPPDSRALSDAHAIVRGADRAATLVRQLLDFARGQELDPELVDLNQVAADAVNFCVPLVPAGVATELHRTRPMMVFVDARQMRRCIVNLIMNARDATDGSGTITVTIEGPAEAGVTGGTAVVRVEDDGCGMTAEQMDHAFEPFFTTKATGTGLGLDAVDQLVTSSGGAVDVSSSTTAGTAFSLRLPLAMD
jgi:PAS domain S-box-containing protein